MKVNGTAVRLSDGLGWYMDCPDGYRFTSKLIPEIRSVSGFDSVYTYRHLINGSFAFISSEHT